MATFALCCGLMSDQSELCYSPKMPSTKTLQITQSGELFGCPVYETLLLCTPEKTIVCIFALITYGICFSS